MGRVALLNARLFNPLTRNEEDGIGRTLGCGLDRAEKMAVAVFGSRAAMVRASAVVTASIDVSMSPSSAPNARERWITRLRAYGKFWMQDTDAAAIANGRGVMSLDVVQKYSFFIISFES